MAKENVNQTEIKLDKSSTTGPWQIAWNRFRQNKIATTGLIIFILIALAVIFVPIISGVNVNDYGLDTKNIGLSAEHQPGTDQQGRDVFFRLFLGGCVSIMVGIIAALITVLLGRVIGSIFGCCGGQIDDLLTRSAKIVYSLLLTPLILVLTYNMLWTPSDVKMYIVPFLAGVLSQPGLARLVRGQILSLREQEFMQVCEASGLSDLSRISKHLTPNVLSVIIVNATLFMTSAILTEVGLSFLGMGVTAPTPSWGNLMELARNTEVFQDLPWNWLSVGIVCLLTVISINLAGEGLHDVFDPKNIRQKLVSMGQVKNKKILDVENLKVYFYTEKGVSKVVDGNNFKTHENEILAIAGESGCGKSAMAMSILGLMDEPGKIEEDSKIMYGDKNLATLKGDEIRKIRGNDISVTFQEPMASLNPVFIVGNQIMENILLHEDVKKKEVHERAVKLLDMVGISRPGKVADSCPHQLSGGMRQRVMIAIALVYNPKLSIADEPTTALDITIQAQILKPMNDLKEKTGTSIMLTTHDLGVVAQMADHVNAMYADKVVESAPAFEIFKDPKHPYTVGLMSSMPPLNSGSKRLSTIEGNVSNPTNLPKGCYSADRCPKAMPRCRESQPHDVKVRSRYHVSCLLLDDVKGEE